MALGGDIKQTMIRLQQAHSFFRPRSADVWTVNKPFDSPCYAVSSFESNRHGKFVIVAVRGSKTEMDWKVNFNFQGLRHGNFIFHRGFYSRAMLIPLRGIRDAFDPDIPLYITGHSLGGATAELAVHISGFSQVHNVFCVTFGQPLVCRSEQPIWNNCTQYFVDQDEVPHVLRDAGYELNRHVKYFKVYTDLRNPDRQFLARMELTQASALQNESTLFHRIRSRSWAFLMQNSMEHVKRALKRHAQYMDAFTLGHAWRSITPPVLQLTSRIAPVVQAIRECSITCSILTIGGKDTNFDLLIDISGIPTLTNRILHVAMTDWRAKDGPAPATWFMGRITGLEDRNVQGRNLQVLVVNFRVPTLQREMYESYTFSFFDGFNTIERVVCLSFENIWFVGMTGAGKSTLLRAIRLYINNRRVVDQRDRGFEAQDGHPDRQDEDQAVKFFYKIYCFMEIIGVTTGQFNEDTVLVDNVARNLRDYPPKKIVLVAAANVRVSAAFISVYRQLRESCSEIRPPVEFSLAITKMNTRIRDEESTKRKIAEAIAANQSRNVFGVNSSRENDSKIIGIESFVKYLTSDDSYWAEMRAIMIRKVSGSFVGASIVGAAVMTRKIPMPAAIPLAIIASCAGAFLR